MKKLAGIILGLAIVAGLIMSACSTTAPNSQVSPTSPTATGNPGAATRTSPAPVLSFIVAGPAVPASDTTSAYQPPPLTAPPQFSIITAPLALDAGQPGTPVPAGATIYHWKNGITEVIGADNSVIFIARDAESKQIFTPGAGPQPATRVLGTPNGAMISKDPNNQYVTIITLGNKLIATVVNKPEPFPYTPTQLLNTTRQFTARGIYTDNSTRDITSQVTWQSSAPAIAAVSGSGSVSALTDGITSITASLSGITSLAVVLTVNSLSSVSVVTENVVGPPFPVNNRPVGFTRQLNAQGTYSDGSTDDVTSQVKWYSSNTAVAAISAGGLITNLAPGTTEITASLQGITSPAVTWTVAAPSPTPASTP